MSHRKRQALVPWIVNGTQINHGYLLVEVKEQLNYGFENKNIFLKQN
jgi:hypothetical protein